MNRFNYYTIITISISICIILTFSSLPSLANELHIENNDSIQLKRINIQKESVLYKIILNSIDQDSTKMYSDYYHIYIHEYKSGHFVKIIKSKYNMLKTTAPYIGYAMLNGYTIIFGFTNYDLSVTQKNNKKYFKSSTKEQFFTSKSILKEWYYYIIDDIYAKYDHNVGWIWSDGKPDE